MSEPSGEKKELLEENALLKQRIQELEISEIELRLVNSRLRESESRLKSISNNLPSAMIYQVIIKGNGTRKFTYLSDSVRQLHGMSPEEGIAEPALIYGNIYENDIEYLIKAENEALKTFSTFKEDVRVKDPSGGIRWSTVVSTPRLMENGSICWDGIEFDITEHKQIEEKLRESEVRYRSLVENASDIVYRTDGTGHFTFVNQAALLRGGYNEEEVIGKHYTSLIRPDMRDEAIRFFGRQFVKEIQNTYSEYPLLSKDGQEFWIGQNTRLIVEDGHVKGFQAVARDITDRRKIEEALRESEEKFRSVVERSLVGIAIIDDAFQYAYVNEEFCKMAGREKQEILGKNFTFLLAEESKLLVAERNRRRQQGEDVPSEYEFLFVQNNGQKRTGEVRSTLFLDSAGKTKVLIQVIDITLRKQSEEKLKESEKKYRELYDFLPIPIYEIDLEANIISANHAIYETFGGSEEDIKKGLKAWQIVSPESVDKVIKNMQRLLEGEQPGVNEYSLMRLDGSVFPAIIKSSPIYNNGNPAGFRGAIIDITERKHAEEALRESEEKFRKLTEASSVGISITDGQRFLYGNPMVLKMSGYSEAEYLSKSILDFITPESRELIRQRAGDRLAGKTVSDNYEIQVLTKDGRIRWADVGAALIEYNGKPASIFTQYDITDRKTAEAEKESLQAQLIRAQKMEALGQLAGGVAHDLNNVLGILSGYSELLLAEIPEGQRVRGYAEKILQSTEKGAAIIQDLLTLARRGVTAADVINLNKVVSSFLKTPVFEKMKDFHPMVTFRTECQDSLLNVKGSPVHLEKTLMNLVSNAAESISGRGEVAIRTENRYLDKAISGYDEVKEGEYALLTVSDTGMGIPAEHREKIFEPFYTKKTMGRSGTGLGLAIVWGTVKDHNGYIDLQTKVGEGTSFTLYFPVTREELIAPQQKVPLEQYMGQGEAVLVVDDIAEQREVASGLLEQLGYKVHAVSNGEEAVEYLKENKADILILDMIMEPGIDGLETYQRILEFKPKQKAILVSGFSETKRVIRAQELGAGAYVRKPYVMEMIGMAIRDELNR